MDMYGKIIRFIQSPLGVIEETHDLTKQGATSNLNYAVISCAILLIISFVLQGASTNDPTYFGMLKKVVALAWSGYTVFMFINLIRLFLVVRTVRAKG